MFGDLMILASGVPKALQEAIWDHVQAKRGSVDH